MAEVWLFGGSTVWGLGQRDDHTIASELARRSEVEGHPIRVVNLGQPGYTAWQQALLFEQHLAVSPPPDLAVFLQGVDDVVVQTEALSTVPAHHNVTGVERALTGRDSARQQVDSWIDSYRDTSLVLRATRRAAAALGLADQAEAGGGGVVDNAAELVARAAALTRHVAERDAVPILHAWEPARSVPGDRGAYRELTARSGPYLDLSGLLDARPDRYLADTVIDEAGARARRRRALGRDRRDRGPGRDRAIGSSLRHMTGGGGDTDGVARVLCGPSSLDVPRSAR